MLSHDNGHHKMIKELQTIQEQEQNILKNNTQL